MYGWQATLRNGTEVRQGQVPYLDLFKGLQIAEFRIVSLPDETPFIRVKLLDNDRVIYRRRPSLKINARTGQVLAEVDHPLWVVVLQCSVNGEFEYVNLILDEVTGKVWRDRTFEGRYAFPELYDCEREAGICQRS